MPPVPVVTPDGQRIKALRLAKGWTPEQLAAAVAPHRHGQAIRAIERGKQASLRFVTEIAGALDVPPDQIIRKARRARRKTKADEAATAAGAA